MVLAVLSHRDLVPAIWLPDPRVREERELARFRMHLVKHKSALKNRVHSTMINFGRPCPVTDLFGAEGRRLLAKLNVPEPWRGNVTASVELIDDLERQIAEINRRLREGHADHPYIPLLMSVPGVGRVLAFTIAAEIGEIERFSSPEKLTGYTGLCPRVNQSGDKDRRGPLTKHGPTYLRWALLEATMHALRHPPTPSATSARRSGSASSAARRSLRSTSPAGSRTRSGTCLPATRSSLPEAPVFVWRPDRPFWTCAPSERSNFA
jgi:transposase